MHHTKEFTKYSFQKKTWLIIALIGKFIVLGAVFAGIGYLLKDRVSSALLLILMHVVLFAIVAMVIFIHKRKSHQYEEECNCEVK